MATKRAFGLDLPYPDDGDSIPGARRLRDLVEAVRRAGRVRFVPPFFRSGSSVRLAMPQAVWVRLDSSAVANPYTATELAPGTRAFVGCFEVNDKRSLQGSVQLLKPTTVPGEWKFSDRRCCTPSPCTVSVTVYGCCGLILEGATVVLTGPGGFSATATTDKFGYVTFDITAAGSGSYTATASHPRTISDSVTWTVSCPAGGNAPRVLALDSPADPANFVCTCCCPLPIKRSLVATLETGASGFLTFNPAGAGAWEGTIALALGGYCGTASIDMNFACIPGGMTPDGKPAWRWSMGYPYYLVQGLGSYCCAVVDDCGTVCESIDSGLPSDCHIPPGTDTTPDPPGPDCYARPYVGLGTTVNGGTCSPFFVKVPMVAMPSFGDFTGCAAKVLSAITGNSKFATIVEAP